MLLNGIQDKKILQIIRASTMWGHIIKVFALGTSIKKILPWYSQGHQSLALWKGVLELYLKGTYILHPYLEHLSHRELSRAECQLSRAECHQVTIPDYYEDSYVGPTYDTTRRLVESAAYVFSPTWHAIATNT